MNKKQKLLTILNYAFNTGNSIIDYSIDDTGILLDIYETDIYESNRIRYKIRHTIPKIPKVVYELIQSSAKPKIELGLNLLLNGYKKK